MLIIAYDISNNKLRTKFSKYLTKFGHRLQFSMYKIKNSPRILQQIQHEIKGNFEKKFDQEDSILILQLSKTCKTTKYGYAKNTDSDLLIV